MHPYSLILASKSPRRRELLSHLGIPFEIKASDIEEKSGLLDPAAIVQDLAQQKGTPIMELCRKERDYGERFYPIVLGADTLVVLEGQILGKPKDKEEAKEMLTLLSGKTHQVFTGVSLEFIHRITKKEIKTAFVCESLVTFDLLDEAQLAQYLSTDESLDKAGAYGIQGGALSFISHLQGSYSNVVGLPLSHVYQNLKELLGGGEKRFSLGEYFAK